LPIFLAGFFMVTNAASESISFESAWLQVQQINYGLAAEQANVERTQFVQEAAKGLYYPRVDLTGTYTRLDDPVRLNTLDLNPLAAIRDTPVGEDIINLLGGDAAFTTDLTDKSFGRVALTALWPVYTGGRITAAQDISAAQNSVAQQLFDARYRGVFEGLVKVYFGVVLAQQNLTTRIDAESGLEQHLHNAAAMEEQGIISRVERLSVEVAHDRAGVATKRARNELEIAEIFLQQLLHRDNSVSPMDALFTNVSLPKVEQFVSGAVDNSPALKTLQAQDTEAQAILKAERGRFHPEVFLFADYAVYKDDTIAFDLVPEWQVGIGVNITLIDRFSRSKTISATEKARSTIANLSNEARRTLSVAAQVLHKEAYLALSEHEGLQSSLELAEENLELRREAFAQGLSTSVEVIDAQLFVAVVRTEVSAAAFHYVDSLARLLALTGETFMFADFQKRGRQERVWPGESS
jgi:outer membrane protein TolC